MSISSSDDDLRRRDRVVSAAQAPLPEPWFIREARGTAAPARAARSRDDDFDDVLPMVAPAPVVAAPSTAAPSATVPLDNSGGGRPPRGTPWRVLAIIAAAIVAAIVGWLAASPKVGGAPPAATLPEDVAVSTSLTATPLDCASPATIARLRDVLVGMARQADGNRDGNLDRRASGLSVGVAAAPDTVTGDGRSLDCRGSLSLLPLGDGVPVAAAASYRIRPAPDGGVAISGLQGVASIVAALARPESAAPSPSVNEPAAPASDESAAPSSDEASPPPRFERASEPRAMPIEPRVLPRATRPEPRVTPRTTLPEAGATLPVPRSEPVPVPVIVQRAPPPREVQGAREVQGRPSFDCRRVTSQVLVAICASPRLSALDAEMSELFFAVRDGADPDTRAELEASRGDFIAKRQSCRDDRCIARVTRERIRELEDTP